MAVPAPENCLDCPNHRVLADPDPDDWFCDDDKAVACALAPNPEQNANSRYAASRNPQRLVTLSCRPYRLREESQRPAWCPLVATREAA